MEDAIENFQNAKEALNHLDGDDGSGSGSGSISANEEFQLCHLLHSLQCIRTLTSTRNTINPITKRSNVSNAEAGPGSGSGMGMIRTTLSYNNKFEKVTLRSLLQSQNDTSQLIEILSTLISHRTPINYDSDADDDDEDGDGDGQNCNDNENQQRSEEKEGWTLNSKALMAGRSYIELSSMDGSWGAGWIDVGVMRNVEALLRRWGEECRGKSLMRSKSAKWRGSARGSGVVSGVNKRKRSEDDGSDSDREMVMNPNHAHCNIDDGNFQDTLKTNESIMMCGLRLANAISEAITCQDYWNWNKDAREAVMDAAIFALGITSALVAPFDDTDPNEMPRNSSWDEVETCAAIVTSLGKAIEYCITNHIESHAAFKGSSSSKGFFNQEEPLSAANRTDPRETTVAFLRASYPILTCQIDLPNASKGRNFAYRNVSKVILEILKKLSVKVQAEEKNSLVRNALSSSVQKTPAHGTAVISKTPRSTARGIDASGRKTPRARRKSLDGTLFIPPSLKKNASPKRSSHKRQSSLSTNSSKKSLSCTILDMFIGLMQKMSTSKGMEKADVRGRIATFLKNCMDEIPDSYRKIFLRSVVQFCRSKVSTHRVFGVDLIGSFLLTEWMWSGNITSTTSELSLSINKMSPLPRTDQDGNNVDQESEFPSANSVSVLAEDSLLSSEVFNTLRGRLSDKVPAVRVRAAAAFSTAASGIAQVGNGQMKMKFQACISNLKLDVLASLRERASADDKATVRRAAIIALADLLFVINAPPDQLDISVLGILCNDASVAVRKSSLDAITSLIDRHHSNECSPGSIKELENAWVDFVLPLVHDSENSCSTKAIESFIELVIDPIVERAQNSNEDDVDKDIRIQSTWRMLSRINVASSSAGSFKGGKSALDTAFKKAFETSEVANQREVAGALLYELHQNISVEEKEFDDRTIGSWCLLECMTSFHYGEKYKGEDSFDLKVALKRNGIGTDFLLNNWKRVSRLISGSVGEGRRAKTIFIATARCCLHVMSALASIMTLDEAGHLFSSLRNSMESFALDVDVIGASIMALVHITQRLHDIDKTKTPETVCKEWITASIQACERLLRKFVKPGGTMCQQLDRALYTIGELTMVGFDPSQDTYHDKLSILEESSKDKSVKSLTVKPSSAIVQLVQSLLLPTLPTENGSANETRVPHKLRAHAFITFGKICLRDEGLAKNSINIFARELRQEGDNSDPAVKSNALIVLGDFCIRYTHHVDRYISLMASCLQPRNEAADDQSESIVRHHAILILSNLILQDYIKWKGVLFYRFLAATVDENKSVANLAKLLLCGPLLTKQSTLFFNNFVDSLFILNGCTAHPMFANKDKRDGYSLQIDGLDYFRVENSSKRADIYTILLSHLSDEEKIGITARLAKEVLSTATEIKGELRTAASSSSQEARIGGAYSVLSDCFQILTSPNMRIGRKPQTNDDADISTSNISTGPSTSLLSSAKGKLLSKISRKHLMETVLPILCSLKAILERSRSPLLRNLMQYLVFIFRQFKKEVNEALVSNQTLLQEIQFDTRQFEKNQKKNDGQFQPVEIVVP